VIAGAVDRQATHVRSCRLGPYSKDCENLLTEIFQAKACLLDPVRKTEYDQGLRDELAIEVLPSVAQVDTRRVSSPKRSKKKNTVWEVTKIVLGGIGGIVLAILILWCGFGVDLFGVMAPEEPKQSQELRKGTDTTVDNYVVEQLKSDLDRAKAEVLVAKQTVDGLRSDNAKLKKDLAERQPVKPQEKSAWIDLLSLVDVNKHAVGGKWSRNEDGITTEPGIDYRITVPSFLEGSYELSVDFTKHTGNDSVSVILPIGTTSCVFYLNGWSGSVHGLGFIDGKYPDELPENHDLARVFKIHNNQRYRWDVKVTVQQDTVTIVSQLDQKPLLSWNGRIDRLSIPIPTAMPNRNALGLGAFQGRCTFHRVELRLADSDTTKLVPYSINGKEGNKNN